MSATRSSEDTPAGGTPAEWYERLVAVSREAFALGHHEAAYHALAAAMHSAYGAADAERLGAVERLAAEQLRGLSERDPPHRLSTQVAAARGARSVYEALAREAAALRLLLERHRRAEAHARPPEVDRP